MFSKQASPISEGSLQSFFLLTNLARRKHFVQGFAAATMFSGVAQLRVILLWLAALTRPTYLLASDDGVDESGAIVWRAFASNPRPLSFFSSPRFELFSSGRHTVHVTPVPKLFENLFPLQRKTAVRDSTGEEVISI